jgi:hypothetical protein
MWQLEEKKKNTHTHTHTHIFSLFEISFGQITKFSQKKAAHNVFYDSVCVCITHMPAGNSESAPTTASRRMDGKWSGNNFLLGSSSLANNHGCYFLLPA